MRCALQNNKKSGQTPKRIVAFSFLICFIMVLLLSGAFILIHADHNHDGAGNNCAVCAHIQNAENLLKASKGMLPVFVGLFLAALCAVFPVFGLQTLINLKVRMND